MQPYAEGQGLMTVAFITELQHKWIQSRFDNVRVVSRSPLKTNLNQESLSIVNEMPVSTRLTERAPLKQAVRQCLNVRNRSAYEWQQLGRYLYGLVDVQSAQRVRLIDALEKKMDEAGDLHYYTESLASLRRAIDANDRVNVVKVRYIIPQDVSLHENFYDLLQQVIAMTKAVIQQSAPPFARPTVTAQIERFERDHLSVQRALDQQSLESKSDDLVTQKILAAWHCLALLFRLNDSL